MKTPAVFFDRDGIVNASPGPGYVENPEDFHVIPEFLAALKVVNKFNYRSVIVTNQRGVALGRYSLATVETIHAKLQAILASLQLRLDGIYVCPHDNGVCSCRKPAPGLLLQAAKELDIDLPNSWMIGDSARDIAAGRNAGCHTVLVGEKSEISSSPPHPLLGKEGCLIDSTDADFLLTSMTELAPFLQSHLKPVPSKMVPNK